MLLMSISDQNNEPPYRRLVSSIKSAIMRLFFGLTIDDRRDLDGLGLDRFRLGN